MNTSILVFLISFGCVVLAGIICAVLLGKQRQKTKMLDQQLKTSREQTEIAANKRPGAFKAEARAKSSPRKKPAPSRR
jgi:uncharacterized membrane protein YciS (DUF1049 family)